MHPTQGPNVPDPSADHPRITVRGPAALAAALPYLIDSPVQGRAVLAAIDSASTLGLTAHRALPEFPAGASPELLRQWAIDVGRLAADGVRALAPRPDEGAAVVLYLPAALGEPPSWFAATVFSQGLQSTPSLFDVIAVFDGRWRSLACGDETCCPHSGSTILDNSDAVLLCAELVAAGAPVATGAAPTLAPDLVAPLLQAMPYPRTVKMRRALLRQAWRLLAEPPRTLQPSHAATLVMAADRPGVRDALLTRMAKAAARDEAFWPRQWMLWQGVAAATPQDWVPGPACMVAVIAWSFGEREQALHTVEQALNVDPTHRMAILIRRLVARGIPAADWFSRMAVIEETDCLRFDRPPAAGRNGDTQGSRAVG